MVDTWFTSDTHFGHANMIKYEDRPFKNVTEMTEKLISNWNERVKEEDNIFFLGDFCFSGGSQGEEFKAKDYIKKLNGNIVFVKGNHDGNNGLNTKIKALLMEAGGLEIYCTHDPQDANLFFPLNLVGHVHNWWRIRDSSFGDFKSVMINVGVDVNNYYPISLNEVLTLYNDFIKNKQKEMEENRAFS